MILFITISAQYWIALPEGCYLMRGNSRINKQQQVKVVIRLKPDPADPKLRCVYLSDSDENELVVETDTKKEIFQFDHVAHEATTQQEIHRMIGQECVGQTFEGYNCCIFAYGQTGAGKTYSVLGNPNDLALDLYCESRGILPRVLEELFQEVQNREAEKQRIICSYMEIYNEQIFDLLSPDQRIHQIREDAKKGVFVQGLTEKRVGSYKIAVGLLLEGEKMRKMATTSMNNQSSRSHAIFSIQVESEVIEEEMTRSKKAKLHIIDLAGSERVKHTNVEGERLRQGCNINRSLHVLGNVINSLVESAKKKKHIPYRDSKLTHYLKDSLGGNSITKLLANVHTSKAYFGDTLSTLMFAKRAKILKMKVELNETTVGNFDALRKQVRRLREELAQARYFKTDGKMSEKSSYEPELDNTSEKHEEISPPKEETLRVLEENELHFKSLIEIYEEHMKTCLSSSHFQRKQNINIVNQWKNLQRRNISLTHLVKRLPSFTRIYRQNLLLKQESNRQNKQTAKSIAPKQQQGDTVSKDKVETIVAYYQTILAEVEQRFKEALQALQRNYLELQGECRQKDKKIKDLRKRKEYPPDIQELKNENQYLHLSILNLENEIAKLQENEQRIKTEFKESKKSASKKPDSRQDLSQEEKDDLDVVFEQLLQIRKQALRQSQLYDLQRAQLQLSLQRQQAEIGKLTLQNAKLRAKHSKSKSKHKSIQRPETAHLHSPQLNTPYDKEEMLFSSKTIKFQNDELKSLQQNFTKEVLVLKMEIKRKQKEINDLRKQLDQYINGDRKIEDEFGKPLEEIIEEYRLIGRKTLLQSKSVKALHHPKEQRRTDDRQQRNKVLKNSSELKREQPPRKVHPTLK